MDHWRGKVAIITTISTGVGAAIAETLVEEGLQVVGFTRRTVRFQEPPETEEKLTGKLHSLKVDITKEQEILQSFQWTTENLGPVHILINAASIIHDTNLTDGDTSKWKQTFDTNVLGLCIATREAVKIMKKYDINGHIINFNNICGHNVVNIENVNVFPASKYALRALTETLMHEVHHLGLKIKISSISPGIVDTDVAQCGRSKGLSPNALKMLKRVPKLEPGDIVDAVVYILSTPPHVQISEMIIKPLGETF